MPLYLVWIALGALGGTAATVVATDAADEIGGAVEQGANALTNLTKWAVVAGILYFAWTQRATIRGLLK